MKHQKCVFVGEWPTTYYYFLLEQMIYYLNTYCIYSILQGRILLTTFQGSYEKAPLLRFMIKKNLYKIGMRSKGMWKKMQLQKQSIVLAKHNAPVVRLWMWYIRLENVTCNEYMNVYVCTFVYYAQYLPFIQLDAYNIHKTFF